MEFLVAQLLNGLVYGVLLFLMAAGLSLIFGLMNVVSLAHGSFFMLGAFFGLSIFKFTGSFWLALILAPIPVVVIGIVMEFVFMRPLYQRGHMDQVLLTFGFTFVFFDLVQTLWGRLVLRLPAPEILQGTVHIGAGVFSAYRLFLIGFGFGIALLLWLFLERSRLGAMVRAGVDNAAMAAGLGANIPALFTGIFGVGVALAALGGVAAGPVLGLYPGMDTEILIPAFIVIVIGGMGSLRGAFIGSLLIGIVDTFGKAYFPSLALFLIYLTMAFVLLIRPQGLFGIKYSGVSAAPAVTAVSAPATIQTRAAGLIALVAMLVFPFLISDYPRALVTEIYIFAIFAMSLDLLLGFTGLMSLGHAAFFGLGAYGVAVLGTMFGVNAWIGLVAGVILAGGSAALIGFFCVRTGGIPFLMLTLAFSQLVFSVALKWRDVTGGSDGLAIAEKPSFFGYDLSNSLSMYFMALIFLRSRLWLAAPPAQRAARSRLCRHPRERAAHACHRLPDARLQAALLHHRRRARRAVGRALCHLQQLHLPGRAVLDRVRRHPDHDHAGRRRDPDRSGDRRRRLPADEERRELLQRALARHHRRHLHLLRHVLSQRPLGRAAQHPMAEDAAVNVLRIDHLHRAFGSLIVTDDLNLTVAEGERHVIIGPNGAGKTSLINQIGGQLEPDSGHIFLKDQDITGQPPNRVSRMGIARTFQRNNLFHNLSVIENLRLAVQIRRGNPLNFFTPMDRQAGLIERARELMRQVHLGDDGARLAGKLSYGEQRQLEIGIALAGEPELLLLDEPTSGMSPAETSRMIDLIASLPRSLSILMIEHDMRVVFSVADRITVLYYGKVLATGTPAEIQANSRVREVYLGMAH